MPNPNDHYDDEWCVMAQHPDEKGVCLDGYDGLNANTAIPSRRNKAVFDTKQEAQNHKAAREASTTGIRFHVIKLEGH